MFNNNHRTYMEWEQLIDLLLSLIEIVSIVMIQPLRVNIEQELVYERNERDEEILLRMMNLNKGLQFICPYILSHNQYLSSTIID